MSFPKRPISPCHQPVCCNQSYHPEPSTESNSPWSFSSPTTCFSALPPPNVHRDCCSPPNSFDPDCYDCSVECSDGAFPSCQPGGCVGCSDCSTASEEHAGLNENCCFDQVCSEGFSPGDNGGCHSLGCRTDHQQDDSDCLDCVQQQTWECNEGFDKTVRTA